MMEVGTITIVHEVVEPNGPGGCNGPPLVVGVGKVQRSRDGAIVATAMFDPPRADLIDFNFDKLTDEELAEMEFAE